MTTPIRPSETSLIEIRQALQRIELNRRTGVQNNLTATSNPGTADDEAAGYSAGSFWFNTDGDLLWICDDATKDAANWVNLFGSGEVAGTGYNYGSVNPPTGDTLTATVKGDTLNIVAAGGIVITGAQDTDTLTYDIRPSQRVTLVAPAEEFSYP